MGGSKAACGGNCLLPRPRHCTRRYVHPAGRAVARSKITYTLLGTDLYHEKIRFSNTNFIHRNGNPMSPLKKPKLGNVRPVDSLGNVISILGQVSTARVPRYLVESLHGYPKCISNYPVKDSGVKIIGFGEPFLGGKTSGANFAFHYQAPELVLSAQLDTCADIWSLGCLACYFMLPISSMSADAPQDI